MSYLLDTNTCIYYINGQSENIRQQMSTRPKASIFICDVVKTELFYGAYKSTRQQQNLAVIRDFFQGFESLPFNERSADLCGQLRAYLDRTGNPIGAYDFQIAAIALAYDLTLVTHNTREFQRIPDLKLTDWF